MKKPTLDYETPLPKLGWRWWRGFIWDHIVLLSWLVGIVFMVGALGYFGARCYSFD